MRSLPSPQARRVIDVAVVVVALTGTMLTAACPAGKRDDAEGTSGLKDEAAIAATTLVAPPAAIALPDAPGLDVSVLSQRLRAAFASTSGLEVVEELGVRRELAACERAPCPEAVADKFRAAAFLVASTCSRVGDVYLVTVRVQRDTEELARTSAQGQDAAAAMDQAGLAAGAQLRSALLAEGVAEAAR